ncbi:efflux transporter outer membrane subunit [Ramlibacter sp. G-1-2-2]|uniref:Efflux transporter outer membrane subunit n=1 Tax=Ramlibacter agri TaxID=2728837 RepID=A0A848GYJ6_9BURK|nr:efflux transporter outer membrane subunit [Ramlibacter agri]NML43237.1 efflux transporter outer membrane subunit [Ramlibacter agri]
MLASTFRLRRPLATLLLPVVLAGCAAVGPDYQQPAAAAPAQWAAPLPHEGSLQGLQDWWGRFHDPVLARLQQAAESDSPTLASAWGNIEIARATLSSARSGASPSVSASASATRSGQTGGSAVLTRSASADASWELDLFGKVRRNVESADAQLAARRADWHDARVSLAAEVATDYVQYRACGLLVDTYEQELVSVGETTKATESLVRAGLSASSDAALARATQASTTSSLQDQRSQCELLVKSLAKLTGLQDAELRKLLANGSTAIPAAPALAVTTVPAQVLRQRPDVGASERAVAAASANIGVAQADLYPSIKLNGSIGLSAGAGSSLTSWSFGPSLSLPIFDGGARKAAVQSAQASYEVSYAQWRDTVRNAVTEVEKALVQLDTAGQRTEQADQAAREYRSYLASAEAERRAGTTDLLTFEIARRQSLAAQLELIALQRDRVTDWITLYRALGGGWDADAPVTAPLSRAPLNEKSP